MATNGDILSVFFVGQQAYTGGTNGLTNFGKVFGHYVVAPGTQHFLYYLTVVCLALTYLAGRAVTRSRFGRLLVAIRDDENRVRFSGYNVVLIKAVVFGIAGAMAGLAGALFVPQVGIISPANLGVVPSIEMVVWVAVGGRGTLIGAVLGAILVSLASTYVNDVSGRAWPFILGGLFILVVVFLPEGIVGFLARLPGRLAKLFGRKSPSARGG